MSISARKSGECIGSSALLITVVEEKLLAYLSTINITYLAASGVKKRNWKRSCKLRVSLWLGGCGAARTARDAESEPFIPQVPHRPFPQPLNPESGSMCLFIVQTQSKFQIPGIF